ncbi:hypothetical protein NEOLEDRAFT_1183005 [Neolentinus lepideus HHB14362 ss-1]|uniref:NADH-ubiquinone oxidoreductase 17.8 kDa subunit n=1 Tax=Neolentinus lepideus HHB14362 ss-1 TaxID=1314782 RepID=A0A165NNW0_9AGAM|nr:hypothetical protein NEOLEDRAFT_1183005 [Neolentinus lepideus HHB14362 ss-1]
MQSLARTRVATLARPSSRSAILAGRRFLASDAHDEHHDEHHDIAPARPEGFTSPGWGYLIALSAAVVAFYKYAPAPGDEAYITRYIKHYTHNAEEWERINIKHLFLSKESQESALLVADARPPVVHRYRYPQMLERASPHLQRVGPQVDLSGVVAKTDKDY